MIEHYISRTPTATGGNSDAAVAGLTDRETEVLGLVGRGLSNDQIAQHLTISIKTVKSHISHLLSKLAARDRAQLVIAAYDAGLVTSRNRSSK